MLPKQHAAYGAAAALALAPLLREQSVALWAGSVLLDVDHYLWYVAHEGDLSLPRAYRYFLDRRNGVIRAPPGWGKGSRPLHGPVPVGLLGLLAWRWPRLRAVFLGVALHSLLDAYAEHRLNALLPLPLRALR
jgi:membrane-bound metal-dependent hydrolase YbcI (DUF457 family)